ncbi:MAG: hypothetical protein WCR52_07155 [Bacteroidota bacterium]
MRKIFFFGICLAIAGGMGCESVAPQPVTMVHASGGDSLDVLLLSERRFIEAEKLLVEHRNEAAARQLHEGILAFRIETGKATGREAARVNRSIWLLTRLRSRLQVGDAVKVEEIQSAIAAAANARPVNHHEQAKPTETYKQISVPVNQ